MRFLVTGANGDIADGIGRILRETWPEAVLIGADTAGDWPGLALFDAMAWLPWASRSDYVEALAQLAREQHTEFVFPITQAELQVLADRSPTPDIPALVMARSPVLRQFFDKLKTADWLRGLGLGAPETRPLAEARPEHLPLIVKPRIGWGSRHISVLETADQLDCAQAQGGSDMITQRLLLPDEQEYTCAIFRAHGALRICTMLRKLVGGVSGRIEVASIPEIDRLLEAIADAAELDGPLNVQLRLTSEGPQVFEVNPRFSSTVMMRHRIGFQDVVWAVRAIRGHAPPPFDPPVGARVFRISREVVVPAGVALSQNAGKA